MKKKKQPEGIAERLAITITHPRLTRLGMDDYRRRIVPMIVRSMKKAAEVVK